MAKFVRQYRFHFSRGEFFNEGVKKHNPLGFADSREVGVAVRAALAAIHHEQALAGKIATTQQGFNLRFKRAIFECFEFIKQRGDERGEEPEEQGIKYRPDGPGP